MCDIRLKHPFRSLIAGASGSGKTTLLYNILLNRKSFISPINSIQKVFYYYNNWQSIYNDMNEKGLVDIFKKRTLTTEEFNKEATPFINNGGSLFIVDDVINDKSSDLCEVFTQLSHHLNASIIFITQNLFPKMRDFRTISINCQYVFLMKSPRDHLQLEAFGRQMFPNKIKFVKESYERATQRPYSYVLYSAHQETEDHLKVLSDLFDSIIPPVAYVSSEYF
jgi:hypothetical protein